MKPLLKRKKDTASKGELRVNILNKKSSFALKEAYVKLRTNLMFSLCADGTNSCRVFEITSSTIDEGKSTTAANLAISFAMLGKKTLLIDADMRKPTINKFFKLENTSGLSDLLANMNSCRVYETSDLPLSIICAGKIPPNPSELLSSVNMTKIIETAKKKYDYVIIDTPPINTVADAQILSRVVDGTVLVIRSGRTTNNDMLASLKSLEIAGGNICGVMLNALNIKTSNYRRYRYDYKNYYYSKYYKSYYSNYGKYGN